MWAALACLGVAAVSCDKLPLLAPSASTITLTTNSSIVQSNGTALIRATVLESGGTPVQNGTTVSFTTNLGTLSPQDARTVNGVATVQFVANGASGIAEIQAASGGAKPADTANPSLKIMVGAAATGRVVVSANPTTVASTGGTATIVANVVDTAGNPLPNVAVSFSTTAGSLSSGIATTDVSGNAQTTLTTNREATVTANAGGAGSTGTTPSGTVVVRVNTSGTVAVSVSPSPAVVGQQVSVSVTLTSGGSPIQRVVLDFGDGGSRTLGGTSTTIPYTYTRAGTYTIRATTFDTLGDSATTTTSLVVGSAPRPTASISGTGSEAGTATTFNLTATPSAGASLESVVVDFGDGSSRNFGSSAPASVQHVYVAPGTYTATLSVSDTNSSNSASTTVVIPAQSTLTVTLTADKNPPSGPRPTTVLFTATVTGNNTPVVRYDWSFSDGPSPNSYSTTSRQTTRVYDDAGTSTATVTATTSGGQTGSASAVVTVP